MNIFTVSDECVVCLDNTPDRVLAPCGHMCCCSECVDEIQKASMPCPLCRSVVQRVLHYTTDQDTLKPVPTQQVDEFKQNERTDYIKRLRGSHACDAAFVGKSKFSRSVSGAITDEFELRQQETKGSERVMAKPSSVEFETINDSTLVVKYKVGRRKVEESHTLMELDAIKRDFRQAEDMPKDALDLATWYPDYYWNIYKLTNRKVSAFMEECGVTKRSRRG